MSLWNPDPDAKLPEWWNEPIPGLEEEVAALELRSPADDPELQARLAPFRTPVTMATLLQDVD